MQATTYDARTLAKTIDHTLLKTDARRNDIVTLCEEALTHQFATVCVNSLWLPTASDVLANSDVGLCSVVGFPLGASLPDAVADEARRAIEAGATEIDMVMPVGHALASDWAGVETGIRTVLGATGRTPLKVILETCLLDDAQKRRACEICRELSVAFVKTSTGFSTGGATAADVGLMREVVGPELGVKASGGIRDRDTALAMLEAGASRLGCSAGVAIVSGGSSDADY